MKRNDWILVLGLVIVMLLLINVHPRENNSTNDRFIYTTQIKNHTDTIAQLRTKYRKLILIDTLIKQKYDTLYIILHGDTTCHTTQRLLAMHRQLDSCANQSLPIEGSGGTRAIK
jgi:hypothetical protein